jgi:cytochrome c5
MRSHAAGSQRVAGQFTPFGGHSRASLLLAWLVILLSLVSLCGLMPISGAQEVPLPRTLEDPGVTPVVGSSWLSQRGAPYGDATSAELLKDDTRRDQKTASSRQPLGALPTVLLTGDALYRLNCQACHAQQGTRHYPEIPSALKPVAGSSLETIRQRLQADAPRADVPALIRRGSREMPGRAHLNTSDVGALLSYLTQPSRAGENGQRAQRLNSWARLGEHVVKGTCHICHDAVTPRRTAVDGHQGNIPSLEALLATKSVTEFVRKARSGMPVMVGDPALLHSGRMPRFDYIRDEEVAAAYLYLATYRPRASERH